MIIESVVSSLLIGKVRKGKIKNIEKTEVRGWYLFILGFAIEAAANGLWSFSGEGIHQFLKNGFIYLHILSYLLIFAGTAMNYKKRSMWLVFAGTLLNFTVIALNGGHMPVDMEVLKGGGRISEEVLQSSLDLTHVWITDTTKLSFLADIIPLPPPYPLPKILSIGDILLGAGVFVFIQEAMILKEE